MEASLTPELAVAYLSELSLDIVAAVALDGRGGYLAGSVGLSGSAGALLAVPEAGEGLAIRTRGGWVVAARSQTAGVVVAASPLSLPALLRHDVSEVVRLLAGGRPVTSPGVARRTSADALQALADAVASAAPRAAMRTSTDR